MGHYDDCYAQDDAKKMGPITKQEVLDLIFRMKREGEIHCYTEQTGDVRLGMVVDECPEFTTVDVGYKRFKIVHKDSVAAKKQAAEFEKRSKVKVSTKSLKHYLKNERGGFLYKRKTT